jgi:hypothetical protein
MKAEEMEKWRAGELERWSVGANSTRQKLGVQ